MEKIEKFFFCILEKLKLKKIVNLYKNNIEVMRYLIFGAITTIVNILTYAICFYGFNIENVISNVIAWIVSVLVAYLTNRKYVFNSQANTKRLIVKEILLFFISRLFTLGVDELIMFLSVDKWHWNAIIMKIISNIIVIILNYILSKVVIFTKKNTTKNEKKYKEM